ncbi:unnamed protein product, partial [Mesorhabditis belari]|uniref:Endoplasmic reticulum vesicle transporter C-terminal domain-containing protein n=1 Tax=Mesorhabditis belari TaxID=2138241 RepID=A0AAF3EX88_9BILA
METSLRQRKKEGITKIVEDFDIFTKVVDNVKEEKRAGGGLLSIICFVIIGLLVFGEVNSYFFGRKEYEYRFDVDTEYEETPLLEFDLVVATPCNSLHIQNSAEQSNGIFPEQNPIKQSPTRFEFTPEEQLYWTVLRHAHENMNKNAMRGLEELQYIDDDIEDKLEHLADQKQQHELEAIKEERKKKGHRESAGGNVVFMIGNGMGMFQIVANNGVDEGTACRVHGKFPVRKGKEEKMVMSIGNGMNIGGMFAHVEGMGSAGNVSHRIERFTFGRRINGLVAPLSGGEQISESGKDVYRYFIKVVPTRIYNGLFGGYTMAYQYSVTFLKKESKVEEHAHGGILFEYEFSATVIEIRQVVRSLLQLILRLCAVVGGVYATSAILNNLGTMGQEKKQFSYLPKIMNGGLAGIVGVTCVFPIDLVKTRLQNQVVVDGKLQYAGIVDCFKKTFRAQGFFGMYSGSGVNILLITPEKAIKLVANDVFRHKLASPGEKYLAAWKGMIAGGLAGFFQISVTTPMELLKIQMQQQGAVAGSKKQTAWQLTTQLFKERGIAGLYRGLGPTMARDVTFSVIYFPLFAYLDSLAPRKADGSGDAVFYGSFLSGLASGAFSSFSVTPLDVIKTRLQTISQTVKYNGLLDAFFTILRTEGPKALFKGAGCRMLVMAPLFGIAQTVYYIGVAEKILGREKAAHV